MAANHGKRADDKKDQKSRQGKSDQKKGSIIHGSDIFPKLVKEGQTGENKNRGSVHQELQHKEIKEIIKIIWAADPGPVVQQGREPLLDIPQNYRRSDEKR